MILMFKLKCFAASAVSKILFGNFLRRNFLKMFLDPVFHIKVFTHLNTGAVCFTESAGYFQLGSNSQSKIEANIAFIGKIVGRKQKTLNSQAAFLNCQLASQKQHWKIERNLLYRLETF